MTGVASAFVRDYTEHVNPQWVRLLDLLSMNREYAKCEGVELTTVEGDVILDFLSGYCVHNVSHNHSRLVKAIHPWSERAR